VKLVIHHQFLDTESVSPVYACDGAERHLLLDQRVVVGSTTQAGFDIDLTQGEPMGILMYELKRKNTKQFNKDAISGEAEARCIQLHVWRSIALESSVYSDLIEHDKGRVGKRDELMKLVE
jgi:hypothetical protein